MLGILLVLSLSLLCRCVTFDIQGCPLVQRAYLVVLVPLNVTLVPLDWIFFEFIVNRGQHVKMV